MKREQKQADNYYLQKLVKRYPLLAMVEDAIWESYELFVDCYEHGGKLLIAGNGGSAADAEHMAGELMKAFLKNRSMPDDLRKQLLEVDVEIGGHLTETLQQSLIAIPLVSHMALSTAYINDVEAESLYAQQLYGYGKRGDVFLAISTRGNSINVINAAVLAKAMGMKVIALTGAGGGRLQRFADVVVSIPEEETYVIQEYHLPIYHCWSMMLEDYFFGG